MEGAAPPKSPQLQRPCRSIRLDVLVRPEHLPEISVVLLVCRTLGQIDQAHTVPPKASCEGGDGPGSARARLVGHPTTADMQPVPVWSVVTGYVKSLEQRCSARGSTQRVCTPWRIPTARAASGIGLPSSLRHDPKWVPTERWRPNQWISGDDDLRSTPIGSPERAATKAFGIRIGSDSADRSNGPRLLAMSAGSNVSRETLDEVLTWCGSAGQDRPCGPADR